MRVWYNRIGDLEGFLFESQGDSITIGRRDDNNIVLKSRFVADRAAVLSRTEPGWELTPLGENEVTVGDHQLHPGERVLVGPGQPIQIFPFWLRLDSPDFDVTSEEQLQEALDLRASALALDVHAELLKRMDTSARDEERAENEVYLLGLERDLEEIARLKGFFDPQSTALLAHFAAQTVLGELIAKTVETAGGIDDVWSGDGRWMRMYTAVPDFENELAALVGRCADRLELGAISDISRRIDSIESGFWTIWKDLADDLYPEMTRYLGARHLKKQIKDIVFGYGPLEDLLRMPNISEIMVVDREKIYIEKNGVLEKSGRRFVSDKVTESIIERIVSRVGRRIDKSQPLVDARLLDGSRVNAVIPPLAISGPCLTIRKFPLRKLTVDDLIARGSLTQTVREFLRAAVAARSNILISGGTGTGKTTLLNCLSDFIPDKERIVTIEDTAELQLHKEHVVRMETKAANVEGTGEYTIRDLVRNALRMRPDRVVVGECRGREALDMLQAMNTGHDGSMTTIHANTSEDVILRLEVLVQMAADLPLDSIHRQIASALDLVVQLTRFPDGSRRVSQVTEIIDYDNREGAIRTKDLFLLEGDGEDGVLMPTGSLPTFMGRLIESGMIDLNAFYL